jgi:hypothetical protein
MTVPEAWEQQQEQQQWQWQYNSCSSSFCQASLCYLMACCVAQSMPLWCYEGKARQCLQQHLLAELCSALAALLGCSTDGQLQQGAYAAAVAVHPHQLSAWLCHWYQLSAASTSSRGQEPTHAWYKFRMLNQDVVMINFDGARLLRAGGPSYIQQPLVPTGISSSPAVQQRSLQVTNIDAAHFR